MCFPTYTHKYIIHFETTAIQKILYITFIYMILVCSAQHTNIAIPEASSNISAQAIMNVNRKHSELDTILAHELTISAWVGIIFFNEFILTNNSAHNHTDSAHTHKVEHNKHTHTHTDI